MKKTYMQPALMLVETESEMMICDSPTLGGSTEETSGNGARHRRSGIFSGDSEGSEGSGSIW